MNQKIQYPQEGKIIILSLNINPAIF